jgi:hypothetical protein
MRCENGSMNWRRGLMRAWVFLSVPRAVFFGGLAPAVLPHDKQFGGSDAMAFLATAVLAPLALLALGYGLRWVLTGFRA